MKLTLPLSPDDMKLLRVPALAFALCASLATAAFFGAEQADTNANARINQARADLTQVRTSIEQISAEEDTIVRYIGRYQEAEADGAMASEDRLDFLETLGELRQSLKLFPVTVEIGNQFVTPLSYSPDDPLPGEPLALNTTVVRLRMGLLHELDLTRLLSAMTEVRGLFQPTRCLIDAGSGLGGDFASVAENLRAECAFHWYSFDLAPAPATEAYF